MACRVQGLPPAPDFWREGMSVAQERLLTKKFVSHYGSYLYEVTNKQPTKEEYNEYSKSMCAKHEGLGDNTNPKRPNVSNSLQFLNFMFLGKLNFSGHMYTLTPVILFFQHIIARQLSTFVRNRHTKERLEAEALDSGSNQNNESINEAVAKPPLRKKKKTVHSSEPILPDSTL